MKKLYSIVGLSLLLVICFVPIIHAQTISGRLTSSIYSWQQRESDSTSANHIRAYQLARFTVGKLGISGLSFHTYFNVSNDFAEKAVDDPRIWLYNCYVNYKTLANTLDLSLGRQHIFAGVGYGTVDGLQVKYRFKDYFRLKVYAGTLAPLTKSYEPEQFKSDNLSWGIQLTSSKLKKVRIGISYAQHSRMPIRYTSPGIYTGRFRLDHPLSALQKHLVGIDLRSFITSKLNISFRLDYNLADNAIRRGQGGLRYNVSKNLQMGLDYTYRTPYIDLNSIFSVFASNPNQEIALHGNYRLNNYRFYLNVATVVFEDDNNLRIGFGGSWKSIYVGYHHRSGYGGDSDGLVANFRYPLREKLKITFGSNFASYKLYSSANERDQLLGGSLGIIYSPNRNLSLQADAQLLSNKMFSHDFRFFFRGSYAFFHRFKR